MQLLLLVLAIVLFILAGAPPYPEPYTWWRIRLLAFGLAAWAGSTYRF
jgi:hypothetical protein